MENMTNQQFNPYPEGYSPKSSIPSNMPSRNPEQSPARLAMLCMGMGIISLPGSCICIGLIFAVISIISGIVSLFKKEGHLLYIVTGYVCSILSIIVTAIIIILFVFKSSFLYDLPDLTAAISHPFNSIFDFSDETALSEGQERFRNSGCSPFVCEQILECDYMTPEFQELCNDIKLTSYKTIDDQVLLIVENLNDQSVYFEATVDFYDASKQLLCSHNSYTYNCPAEGSCALIYYAHDDDYNTLEYDNCSIRYCIDYTTPYSVDCSKDVTVKCKIDSKDQELKVTYRNTGSPTINSLYVIYVFWKDDTIVRVSSDFICNLEKKEDSFVYLPTSYDDLAFDDYCFYITEASSWE